MQVNAFTILLLASFLVSFALAAYALHRRSVHSSTEFALLMLAVSLWAICAALEAGSVSRTSKIVWSVLSYVGSQSTPVLFLVFVLRYTHQDRWLTRCRIALLFVVPFISVVLSATNGLHGLLWPTIVIERTWAGVTAVYSHGPWFWVEIAYGYLLILIGTIALVRAVLDYPHLYSRQARVLVVATLFPWIASIMYVLGLSFVKGLDIAPVGFTIAGLLVAFAIFRYRLLDLSPIARNAMFDSILDIMVAIDADRRIVDANPATLELVGGTAGSVIGRSVGEILGEWPELESFIEGVPTEVGGTLAICRAGEKRYYDPQAWPFLDRQGREVVRLVALRDVTELKLAEEELRRINVELDGYAHTVSHDLKGLITGISLTFDAAESMLCVGLTDEKPAQLSEVLSKGRLNVERTTSLINDLLFLAESGEPRGALPVALSEILAEVLEEKSMELAERGVRVESDTDLGEVVASPIHIYQLFDNLIKNSAKYAGRDDILIEIRRLPPDEGNRYLFRDNGKGIPESLLPHVFDRFFKGDKGGSGIGLAIVEKLVRTYGGEIRAYNDGGACFEFTLKDFKP